MARAKGRGHNAKPRLWRSPEVGVATAEVGVATTQHLNRAEQEVGVATAEVGVATTQHLNRAEQEVGVATAKGAWPRRST